MGSLTFDTNNNQKMTFHQDEHDGNVVVLSEEYFGKPTEIMKIPAGDMVMLANLYKWTKENNVFDEFINPNGINEEKEQFIDTFSDELYNDLLKTLGYSEQKNPNGKDCYDVYNENGIPFLQYEGTLENSICF